MFIPHPPGYLFDVLLEKSQPESLVQLHLLGLPQLLQVSLVGQHLRYTVINP